MTPYRPAPRYLELGEGFADAVDPADFPKTIPRFFNERWAARIGLADLDENARRDHFARFVPLKDNFPRPLAMRYHGHQFRNYNPNLGDGRGFLFAQLLDDQDRLLDLGTKGSGRTPWSRSGDGRLTLKGGVREILATELLEARGVDTSKTLSIFETGESLHRGDEPSPTRSCVLVRLSHSHIRFGSFQRFAFHQDAKRMKALLEWATAQYHPDLVDAPDLPAAFLARVADRSARLASQWMAAGFVHGVLNTDNMNVTGESFDYGPWRFLPRLDLSFTAAYFDHGGLYAYGRQPDAVFWNLNQLAKALSLIGDRASLEVALADFEHRLRTHSADAFRKRLGVSATSPDEDDVLIGALFEFARDSGIGFEPLFFDLYGGERAMSKALSSPRSSDYQGSSFEALRSALADREGASRTHAYFQRDYPCDMRVEEVEEIWARIDEEDDWSALEWKIDHIRYAGEAYRMG